MLQRQSVNIRQISQNRAEQVGYYRFLENENVTISELVRSVADQCQMQVGGPHVLSISDSSEINLQAHAGRLQRQGLGVVGNNRDVGFFIHPTLVLNAQTGFPLGVSAIHLWTRDFDHADKHQRDYQNLPIEEKESYKWLLSAESSNRCLRAAGARLITHIGDRESDLYEEWASVPDAQSHLLIRVRQNRRLLNQQLSLYDYLSTQPTQCSYTVQVVDDPPRGQLAREAWLAVRVAQVEIQRPDNLCAQDYLPSVALYAVEAQEVSPPPGQAPIHGRVIAPNAPLGCPL